MSQRGFTQGFSFVIGFFVEAAEASQSQSVNSIPIGRDSDRKFLIVKSVASLQRSCKISANRPENFVAELVGCSRYSDF